LVTSTNNQNANIITRALSSTSPLNAYHNSLRKMRNDEKCLCRNSSLRRSFKKINNDSPCNHHIPHHCTIELKTKASSCLHLFHKNAPVILTTFKNQQQNDQQNHNEILWRYQLSQYDLSKNIKASSQCNLNVFRHNYHPHHHHQHEMIAHVYDANSANNNSSHNINNSNNNTNALIAETKFHNSLENQSTL